VEGSARDGGHPGVQMTKARFPFALALWANAVPALEPCVRGDRSLRSRSVRRRPEGAR
jgi:hypothetical protein